MLPGDSSRLKAYARRGTDSTAGAAGPAELAEHAQQDRNCPSDRYSKDPNGPSQASRRCSRIRFHLHPWLRPGGGRNAAGTGRVAGVQRPGDRVPGPPRVRGRRRARALSRARDLGLFERGPVPAGRAAGRLAGGARASSPTRRAICRPCWSSACRCAPMTDCSTARWCCSAAVSSAPSRSRICRTIASSTRSASSRRRRRPCRPRCGSPARTCPSASELLFAARNLDGFVLHVEICEDLWVPLPPSTLAALAGATLIANLSASDITVGKADYRRLICAAQSAKCVAAYLYSAAGPGESTTDLAWDGQALVYENGERLAESQRFPLEGGLITADIDLDHLRQERTRLTSFGDCVQMHAARLRDFRRVEFDLEWSEGTDAARAARRAFPVRAGRSRASRRALCRGLRHPGRGTDEAARVDRPQEGRHRHLGRTRLDTGGAGRRARL